GRWRVSAQVEAERQRGHAHADEHQQGRAQPLREQFPGFHPCSPAHRQNSAPDVTGSGGRGRYAPAPGSVWRHTSSTRHDAPPPERGWAGRRTHRAQSTAMPSTDRPAAGAAGAGRFAPSPSGDLHLGNLRTALLAWLFARSTGRAFRMRMEDLDERTRADAEGGQLRDLAALGLDWDGETVHQSLRRDRYDAAIALLADRGLTYECFCTRREIRSAPSAPHAPEGAYPGTCRNLTDDERAAKRASGKPPALRLRVEPDAQVTVDYTRSG